MDHVDTPTGRWPWRCYHGTLTIRPRYRWDLIEGVVRTEPLECTVDGQDEAEVLVWLRPDAPEPERMRDAREVTPKEVETAREYWRGVNDERAAAVAGSPAEIPEDPLASFELALAEFGFVHGEKRERALRKAMEAVLQAEEP